MKNAAQEIENGIFCVSWAPSVALLTCSWSGGKDWKLQGLQFGPDHYELIIYSALVKIKVQISG